MPKIVVPCFFTWQKCSCSGCFLLFFCFFFKCFVFHVLSRTSRSSNVLCFTCCQGRVDLQWPCPKPAPRTQTNSQRPSVRDSVFLRTPSKRRCQDQRWCGGRQAGCGHKGGHRVSLGRNYRTCANPITQIRFPLLRNFWCQVLRFDAQWVSPSWHDQRYRQPPRIFNVCGCRLKTKIIGRMCNTGGTTHFGSLPCARILSRA